MRHVQKTCQRDRNLIHHFSAQDFDVIWHGTRPFSPDWSPGSRVLAFEMRGGTRDAADVIYVAMNMYWERLDFELPTAPDGRSWHVFANTAAQSPADIHEPGMEILLENNAIRHEGRSVIVLVARRVS